MVDFITYIAKKQHFFEKKTKKFPKGIDKCLCAEYNLVKSFLLETERRSCVFDKKQMEAALVLADLTHSEFAALMKMNATTLYRKMNGITEWSLSEISRTGEILGKEKVIPIFFGKEVS